jgi:hypothetical protein
MLQGSLDDPRLKDVAKHFVANVDRAATSDWPEVQAYLAGLGIGFDAWQDDLNLLALARKADGSLLCGEDGMNLSTMRQVGKSFDFGWLFFGVCLLRPNTLVLWTAQRLATANETYRTLGAMARDPRVRKLVTRIAKDHGNSGVIEFTNGSRIVFGSRDSGFGRGWTKVDILMLDEAQSLTEAAMEDMVPATAASDLGLVVLAGTPPRPADRSETFRNARQLALDSPVTFDGVWVEFGAPDGWDDPDDLEMLAQVNPAVRRGRVNLAAVRRMLRRLKDKGSKLREVFGVWDARRDDSGIDMGEWEDTLSESSPDTGALAYAVNMDPDGYASIGVAAKWPDGRMHVEVVDSSYTPLGSGSLVEWLAKRKKVPVALLRSSMTQQLEPQLRAAGVKTTVATGNDFCVATSMLTTGVHEKTVTHYEQLPLDVAVVSATTRPVGTVGGVAWDLSKQDVPMSPLVAVTLANWLAQSAPRRRGGVW